MERHADGGLPAGRSDAVPLGRADPLAAREPPRGPLAQRRIHVNYRYTQLRIESAAPTDRHAFDQRLQLNFTPAKNLVLQLTGEHYRTQLSDTRSKHLILADVSLRWKAGLRWEFFASAANLLNETEYAYTLFDGLSSSACRYAIRPRDLLVGFNWKF